MSYFLRFTICQIQEIHNFLSECHNDLNVLLLIETIKEYKTYIALSYHSTIPAQ